MFQNVTIRKKKLNKKPMAREGNLFNVIQGGLRLTPPSDKEIVYSALRAQLPSKVVPK